MLDLGQIPIVRAVDEGRRFAGVRVLQPAIFHHQFRRARAERMKENSLRVHLEGGRTPSPHALYLILVEQRIGESKGIHLKNDDTDYKRQVFKLCNKLAEEKSWTELGLEFPERKMVFELVYGDEWQKVLNGLLK